MIPVLSFIHHSSSRLLFYRLICLMPIFSCVDAATHKKPEQVSQRFCPIQSGCIRPLSGTAHIYRFRYQTTSSPSAFQTISSMTPFLCVIQPVYLSKCLYFKSTLVSHDFHIHLRPDRIVHMMRPCCSQSSRKTAANSAATRPQSSIFLSWIRSPPSQYAASYSLPVNHLIRSAR